MRDLNNLSRRMKMATFCYYCEKCHKGFEVGARVGQAPEVSTCDKCGQACDRDYPAEFGGRPPSSGAKWPIYSEAAGIHPDQVTEAVKMYPHHEYDKEGRMVFRSRAHRRRCLKDIGMVDEREYR
jgi:hypothetical protein